jgi:hypothetical protein
MAQSLTRSQLHDLVWSTPGDKLSAQWSVSYPTLKKTCEKFDIPIPPRGHWAKVEAGKPVTKVALPARSPGMSDEIYIGARYYWQRTLSDEELLGPLPEPPSFPDDIAEIRDQIRNKIGKVNVGRVMTIKHAIVSRLLGQDDARREKQKRSHYTFSWEKPIFETPFELRRLRVLNALFLALARCGGKAEVRGHEARDITVTIHQTAMSLALDRPKQARRVSGQEDSGTGSRSEPLRLAIVEGYERVEEKTAWQDGEEGLLEHRLAEIATEIVVAAELRYREACHQAFEWRAKRKAGLEEELRCQELERQRKERERQEKLAQARIDRLLDEAASLRRAADIRAYVDAVEHAVQREGIVASHEEIAHWAAWARTQADTIDPVKNGRFLQRFEEDDPAKNKRGSDVGL